MKQMDFASLSYEKKAQKKDSSQNKFLSQIIKRTLVYLGQSLAPTAHPAAGAQGTEHILGAVGKWVVMPSKGDRCLTARGYTAENLRATRQITQRETWQM